MKRGVSHLSETGLRLSLYRNSTKTVSWYPRKHLRTKHKTYQKPSQKRLTNISNFLLSQTNPGNQILQPHSFRVPVWISKPKKLQGITIVCCLNTTHLDYFPLFVNSQLLFLDELPFVSTKSLTLDAHAGEISLFANDTHLFRGENNHLFVAFNLSKTVWSSYTAVICFQEILHHFFSDYRCLTLFLASLGWVWQFDASFWAGWIPLRGAGLRPTGLWHAAAATGPGGVPVVEPILAWDGPWGWC